MKVKDKLLDIYEGLNKKNGTKALTRDQLSEMMNEETLFTAEEAVEFGFATQIFTDVAAQAMAKYEKGVNRQEIIKKLKMDTPDINNQISAEAKKAGLSESEYLAKLQAEAEANEPITKKNFFQNLNTWFASLATPEPKAEEEQEAEEPQANAELEAAQARIEELESQLSQPEEDVIEVEVALEGDAKAYFINAEGRDNIEQGDETDLADGEYKAKDGRTITVEANKVTGISAPASTTNSLLARMKNKSDLPVGEEAPKATDIVPTAMKNEFIRRNKRQLEALGLLN
jgi:hypothetical protein